MGGGNQAKTSRCVTTEGESNVRRKQRSNDPPKTRIGVNWGANAPHFVVGRGRVTEEKGGTRSKQWGGQGGRGQTEGGRKKRREVRPDGTETSDSKIKAKVKQPSTGKPAMEGAVYDDRWNPKPKPKTPLGAKRVNEKYQKTEKNGGGNKALGSLSIATEKSMTPCTNVGGGKR